MQKNTENQPGGEILLYQTEDGRTRIECRFEDNTLWLTQAQMAKLFQTTPQNITLHLKAIYAEGEQSEEATCKSYLQVRREGGRTIQSRFGKACLRTECRQVYQVFGDKLNAIIEELNEMLAV